MKSTYFRENCEKCYGKGSIMVKTTYVSICSFGNCRQKKVENVKERCMNCSGHGYLVLKLYPNKKNLFDVNDCYDYAPQRQVSKKVIAVKVNGRDEIYTDWQPVRRILENHGHAQWKVFKNKKEAWYWLNPFKYPPNGQMKFITDYMKLKS